MVKFHFLLILFSVHLYSLNPDNLLLNDVIEIETIVKDKIVDEGFEKHNSALPKKILKEILKDPSNKVSKTFDIPKYFADSTLFWGQIYTQFSSKQVLIHDKNDLSIVYDALDFSSLYGSKLNRYQRARKRSSIIDKTVKKIKAALREIGKTKNPKTKFAQELRQHLINLKVRKPRNISRRKYFNSLADNVRAQTGQRDKIFQGIINVYPFQAFLYSMFEKFELPKELLAISFVESSFNLKATSKVGASGVWQIMPVISKKILPEDDDKRPRRNVLLASLGAMHLLAQNFQILDRWDLAVTAYNSGTKHLLRAKRKYKKRDISLGYILQNYKTKHLGFASKNFYSEFLALVYILQYKERLFPLEGINFKDASDNPQLRYKNINVYVSKCGLIPNRLFSALKNSSPYLNDINNHFKKPTKMYSRGSLVFSDIHLTSRRYYQLTSRDLRRNYPKNYKKLIKGKGCLKI